MPPNKKPRYPPTEGAYTLRDLYGEMGMSDLRKMVTLEGKPTKEALVDELVRSVPLDNLDMNRLKQICVAFGVPGGGRKEDCAARLKKLLKQDAPKVPVALAVEKPKAADEDHLKDQESCASSTSVDKRAAVAGDKEDASLRDVGEKVGQKRKENGNVAEGGLVKKTKQAEEEAAEPKASTNAPSDDFSIKMCISVLTTMEELSSEEKVEAFEVFKDAQNREIFVCAEPTERLLWLRKAIGTQTALDYYDDRP
ncbi:hypothetical protein EJB05_04213 [Eragrostis curvula]|uniref:SAP domain-containing protein n=1 Tax=Eragrostis curvula TaxID=38414 RepID=A0A5J9WA11_9POAL|nr:hypothetical protein EJB05_04213 [Eragrostis curvula]